MKNELSNITSFDGTKIYYKKNLFKNNNPTLLFLHGFGGDLGAWNYYQDNLSKQKISNLAIDLRGHGYSDRSDDFEFYNLQNFVKDIINVLEYEHIKSPVLVGHCFGGMVCLMLEKEYPKLSKELILISTSYKTPYFSDKLFNFPLGFKLIKTITSMLSKNGSFSHNDFSKFNYNTDLDYKRFINDIKVLSPKSYFYLLENLLLFNSKQELPKIKKPTLIIQGEKDIVVPANYAQFLHENIKKSKLVILKNEHHVPVLNNPKNVYDQIITFII